MAPRTRTAPAAFGRGLSQVVANPGLILAPLAVGGASFAALGATVFVAVLAFGRLFATARFARGPEAFLDLLGDLRGRVLAAPFTLLAVLLGVLAVLLFLTALAAWVRAGVTGALAEADACAGEDAPVTAFRHPGIGGAFFGWAGRRFGAFFALVNIYALVATVLVAILLVPLAGLFAGVLGRNTLLLAVSGLAVALAVPLLLVGGAALRAVYLVAGRVLVTEPALDALGAVARAMALVKESPGRTAVLYLLTVAGAMAVAAAFVVPRIFLTLLAGYTHAGLWAPFAVSGVFILLQVLAALAFELVVTGSFVALWPAGTAPGEAPSALERAAP